MLDHYEPPPPDLIHDAAAMLTWRTVDAELADLLEESGMAGVVAVRDRPGSGVEMLVFASPDLVLDVEIVAPPEPALRGRVAPAGRGAVELQVVGAEARLVRIDERGRFHFPG